ncbi:hypothetical protein [Agrobacterium sp. SORGH_AS 787]|uniref:hypothetical protein n=1 Tax=Agrobacterium sp. SORGH_AS 787 TaxID=3041775 RepID=UPI00277D4FCA|nr:hypothetical protein [Rhizobium sp. SORGH_AS_0787]
MAIIRPSQAMWRQIWRSQSAPAWKLILIDTKGYANWRNRRVPATSAIANEVSILLMNGS